MTVSAVLKDKGGAIVSVSPGQTIGEAAKLLAEKRIGAVLALGEGGALEGILSERDIVRALAEEGPGVLDKPVRHIMTRHVKRCAASDTMERVMALMTEGRFRHMPVMDGDALIGVISIGDVVRRRLGEMEREAKDMRDYVRAGAA